MNFTLFNILGYTSPILMALLVLAAAIRSYCTSKKTPSNRPFPVWWKATLLCLFHLSIAIVIFWHLITGGWLSEHYHWNDPDNINLVLAIFEAVAVATVIMLPVLKKRFVYLLLINFMFIQLLLAALFIALVLLFVFTWKPRMF